MIAIWQCYPLNTPPSSSESCDSAVRLVEDITVDICFVSAVSDIPDKSCVIWRLLPRTRSMARSMIMRTSFRNRM